ncbi:MAG: hypothetical protein WCD08_03905 [Steroidobacteraceae bacterium]
MSASCAADCTSRRQHHVTGTMKLYGSDDQELMRVTSLARDGNNLLIKGKIFGSMPLTARLKPEEVRAALKLMDFRTVLFLLTMIFRKTRS